ncbi:MAG: helix-turn-helix domain-containing protein [Clostridia bacterium]|nr:helix-turn-helix domain-containing protein [Clostridia bacterium]
MGKNIDNVFGQRLKELREDAGLSMLQLAKAIGVSDAAICKWENGLAEPKVTYLVRLSVYFDCTIDYITGKEDGYVATQPKATVKTADGVTVAPFSRQTNNPHIQAVVTPMSPEECKLLQSIQKLTPERKALLKETVNAWNNVSVENPDKKPD